MRQLHTAKADGPAARAAILGQNHATNNPAHNLRMARLYAQSCGPQLPFEQRLERRRAYLAQTCGAKHVERCDALYGKGRWEDVR